MFRLQITRSGKEYEPHEYERAALAAELFSKEDKNLAQSIRRARNDTLHNVPNTGLGAENALTATASLLEKLLRTPKWFDSLKGWERGAGSAGGGVLPHWRELYVGLSHSPLRSRTTTASLFRLIRRCRASAGLDGAKRPLPCTLLPQPIRVSFLKSRN